MDELLFDGWRVEYDARATSRAYESAGEYDCTCASCRNFFEVRERHFPARFSEIFRSLAVDPGRPSEIYDNGPGEDGTYLYAGFYHFVGCIREDPYRMSSLIANDASATEWQFFFADRRDLAPASFDGQPVVQLEFTVKLPWDAASGETPTGR